MPDPQYSTAKPTTQKTQKLKKPQRKERKDDYDLTQHVPLSQLAGYTHRIFKPTKKRLPEQARGGPRPTGQQLRYRPPHTVLSCTSMYLSAINQSKIQAQAISIHIHTSIYINRRMGVPNPKRVS